MKSHFIPNPKTRRFALSFRVVFGIAMGFLFIPTGTFARGVMQDAPPMNCAHYVDTGTQSSQDLVTACRVREKFGHIITPVAHLHEYNQNFITAVIVVESEGNVNATSRRGAKGLMQLMPSTATAMGAKDIRDPLDNILAGTRYLRKLEDDFGFSPEEALLAYNMGPARATVWLSQEGRDASDALYVRRVLDIYHTLLNDDARKEDEAKKLTTDALLTKVLLKLVGVNHHQSPPQLMSARRTEIEEDTN